MDTALKTCQGEKRPSKAEPPELPQFALAACGSLFIAFATVNMHPLRLVLLFSLAVAFAVAAGLGSALDAAGVTPPTAIALSIAAFVAFMVPWGAVFFWALRRAADLDELTDRAREVAEGRIDRSIADRAYHGELDELARAIDELRSMLVRQKASFEEHRAAMEEIVASLGEGLVALSRSGRIVFGNRRVGELFGVETAQLVGRSILEVVRKQSMVNALDSALGGQPSTDRISFGSGENERQIEVRAFPVEASPEIAAVALFLDVSTLERLQRVRKDFLDDFSHEVRTPLAGLRSAADTLEQGDLTREYESQLRNVMHRQIARIERLVKSLSELNQIESGQIVLQRRPVPLRQLLCEVCEEVAGTAGGAKLRVEGDDVMAYIDRSRAGQIFANLVDNACRHGGAEGEVTVEVRRENGDAVVRVFDQGPGIPPAELERIFHRFYRVDRSRSQAGTGLGLAIAKHLVVAHGGSIRASNRPSGGAMFEVRLPAG